MARTALVGCVLPAGPVRTIASSEHADTADYGYAIDRVAGRIAMLTLSGGNQYAYDMSTVVRDLRGGHSYEIAHLCSPTGGGDWVTGGSTTASAAFVTNAGRAVAAIVPAPDAQPTATGPVTIAGFDPHGTRADLDTGSGADLPASSLALAGKRRLVDERRRGAQRGSQRSALTSPTSSGASTSAGRKLPTFTSLSSSSFSEIPMMSTPPAEVIASSASPCSAPSNRPAPSVSVPCTTSTVTAA
jgi:hypothetical protein